MAAVALPGDMARRPARLFSRCRTAKRSNPRQPAQHGILLFYKGEYGPAYNNKSLPRKLPFHTRRISSPHRLYDIRLPTAASSRQDYVHGISHCPAMPLRQCL